MSYRTIKRLLGETSLERKCRFLFGGGLVLLIAGSFWFYARMTSDLVYAQNRKTARALVPQIILEKHSEEYVTTEFFKPVLKELSVSLKPEELREYSYTFLNPDPPKAEAAERPVDEAGYDALEQLRQQKQEVIDIRHDLGEYHYYGEVRAAESCMSCHGQPGLDPEVKQGDLIRVVKISFPLDSTYHALNRNNAFLLAMAIVTAFLAMVAAWAIVRYVIVKPVLHLKDVSDEIARGNLDLRADIRTGDEFEELSHAFNRMLRHLTTVQEELREVNTDLDRKVDELAHVNLQLYEMNKLKDEFLATMSHELRTPLNSILGFSDVMAGADNLTDKQRRYLDNIQASGKSLMLLINDVLDLAKIESGKMELQVVEFSASDVVDRQVTAMHPMAEKKNIDLTSSVDAQLPLLVQDQGKIEQILNNLLSNAMKFTPEGGRVEVRARRSDEAHFELTVADTGIGIPLEDQETIFEKFRQGQSIPGQKDAMTREHGGTGLGLSIVKELSKLLDGEVSLESEFGKGSTFTVRLPVRLDHQQPELSTESGDEPLGLEQPPEFRPVDSAVRSKLGVPSVRSG